MNECIPNFVRQGLRRLCQFLGIDFEARWISQLLTPTGPTTHQIKLSQSELEDLRKR